MVASGRRWLLVGVATLVLLVTAGSAWSQSPVPLTHSLNMEAHPVSAGGSGKASSGLHVAQSIPLGGGWSTADVHTYSQHQSKDSSVGLEVVVRNLAHNPDTAKLDWYFFARSIDGKKEFLFDRGETAVQIAAGVENNYQVRSKAVHSSITKTLETHRGVNGLGQNLPDSATVHKSGSKVEGWLVRLLVDGRPTVIRASSPSFETLGQTNSSIGSYSRDH